MIESNEFIAIIGALLSLIIVLGTILVIDYASKKTGRDTQKDIQSVINLLETVKKAYEDGEVTETEYEEIKEALLLAKDNVKPYVDIISESGIIAAIYIKIKKWIS